ncbi:MAG: acetolactate synthase large subunit [Candidatus Omnitrophica bacterium]|nr:acetolactate synthase large subunit [Candidatus Omnitrophota bacterium]
MKASDLLVKSLEKEGVEYVFGVPGEENLDFLESLRKSNIKMIVTRHEQAAGFMAATCGRLTGKAGVCLSTLGPGATNLVTAAGYAQLGAMPMLMITEKKPIKTSKQGEFQIENIVDMMRPLTKYTRQIVHGNNIPSRVREAFRRAEEERPGAVHLEFPEDVAEEMVDLDTFDRSFFRRPIAEVKAIKKAIELIESAKHPLILIGAGANRQTTSKRLTAFIDESGIPFICTQMGKGVVDERHPLYLGNAALSENDFVHCAIKKADLIINVGHDVVEKPPFFMRHDDSMKVIHVNFSSAEVDPVYFPQVEVVGDIANSIRRISSDLEKQSTWDFDYFMDIKKKLDAHIEKGSGDSRFPIFPQRLVADVRKVMPDDGIIALDNGMYKIWFARHYRAYAPNTILLDNALASMGAGLPSAMAAKIVHPDKKVIAICGDGGFMMNSQELETAVRLKLDINIIILRDDAYGMIKWKQNAMNYPDYGLDYGNPDFVKYAESYGARGHRLQSTEEFEPLLRSCINSGKIDVIDVPIDYSENKKILIDELAAITKKL